MSFLRPFRVEFSLILIVVNPAGQAIQTNLGFRLRVPEAEHQWVFGKSDQVFNETELLTYTS